MRCITLCEIGRFGVRTVADELTGISSSHSARIEVAGHTDSRGTEDHNLALSQQRAETVLRYLSDRGVDNELTARGYGESRPIADNAASDGRARNRRVTLRIMGE